MLTTHRLQETTLYRSPSIFGRVALLSASPGIREPYERIRRAQQDDAAAETLREEGMEGFLQRWYQADMWGHLRESPR
jgi:hypothetical protein